MCACERNIFIIDTKFFTVVIVVLFHLLVRKWIQGGQFHSNVRIDGKVVIVTGCNTGIYIVTHRNAKTSLHGNCLNLSAFYDTYSLMSGIVMFN